MAGVIYIDSGRPHFYLDDGRVERLASIAQHILNALGAQMAFNRIRNMPLVSPRSKIIVAEKIPKEVQEALEFVDIRIPRTSGPFQFNYDLLDITSVE